MCYEQSILRLLRRLEHSQISDCIVQTANNVTFKENRFRVGLNAIYLVNGFRFTVSAGLSGIGGDP